MGEYSTLLILLGIGERVKLTTCRRGLKITCVNLEALLRPRPVPQIEQIHSWSVCHVYSDVVANKDGAEERADQRHPFRVGPHLGLVLPHLADLVSRQSLLGHAARDSGQGQRTAHFRFKLTTLGTCGRVHPHRGVHQRKRVGQLLVKETEKQTNTILMNSSNSYPESAG